LCTTFSTLSEPDVISKDGTSNFILELLINVDSVSEEFKVIEEPSSPIRFNWDLVDTTLQYLLQQV
jgi:hypothetical protein